MPTTEWLKKYESIKDKLTCKDDLEAHFTEKVIGNMGVDVLDIGAVHFTTGQIFACDPLVELEDTLPFLQTIPAGTYPLPAARQNCFVKRNCRRKVVVDVSRVGLIPQLVGIGCVSCRGGLLHCGC